MAYDGSAPRSVGVEEEMFLVDPHSAALRPASGRVVRWAADMLGLQQELFLQQIEIASPPCRTMADLHTQVVLGRTQAAASARESGVELLAVGTPVIAALGVLTPSSRYQRLRQHYGEVARDNLVCGLHVHVGVEDLDEAVAAVDGMRAWLPVLLALSANSPFWHDRDTEYASFRSQVNRRWPTAGPAEPFGDAQGYRLAVADLQAAGAALDPGQLYFDARPSARYPTVEVRVADTCTDVRDTVVIAALTRALVSTAIADWRAGVPEAPWRSDLIRAANWVAAKSGLSRHLVDPLTRRLAPASDVVQRVLDHCAESLEEAGDTELAADGVRRLLQQGTGSVRQRAALARVGTPAGVVLDAIARTAQAPAPAQAVPAPRGRRSARDPLRAR